MRNVLACLALMLMLTGCSLGEMNESIQYVNEATDHIHELSNFAEDAPAMIREAANDQAVKEELTNRLTSLKEEIKVFNDIEAPDMAKDIHQQLVNQNKEIMTQINQSLKGGQVAIDQLKNSQIVQTIRNATELLNRIENLGM